MAIDDLPGCVQPQLESRSDIEYLVNEYLARKGYFEDLERLRADNHVLKKELQTSDREIHKLRKSDEIVFTRRRCVEIEEEMRTMRVEYEKTLMEMKAEEVRLISLIHKQKSELMRLTYRPEGKQATETIVLPTQPHISSARARVETISPDDIIRGLSVIDSYM